MLFSRWKILTASEQPSTYRLRIQFLNRSAGSTPVIPTGFDVMAMSLLPDSGITYGRGRRTAWIFLAMASISRDASSRFSVAVDTVVCTDASWTLALSSSVWRSAASLRAVSRLSILRVAIWSRNMSSSCQRAIAWHWRVLFRPVRLTSGRHPVRRRRFCEGVRVVHFVGRERSFIIASRRPLVSLTWDPLA